MNDLCRLGTKNEIDAALALIRAKFPLKKYPHLTLTQINITLESAIPVLPDSIQVMREKKNDNLITMPLLNLFFSEFCLNSYTYLKK